MNTPTTQVELALKHLQYQLTVTPTNFAQLWQDHASLWQTLGWSEAQTRLYLRCLPSVAGPAAGFDLADEMVTLLSQAGRPMPLAQLLNKMPPGRVLTEAMLRSAAAADLRLTLAGPTVRLA